MKCMSVIQGYVYAVGALLCFDEHLPLRSEWDFRESRVYSIAR